MSRQRSTTFPAVALPSAAEDCVDVIVEDGRIAALEPRPGPARSVLLPPLADLHLHANRAFTLGTELPDSLEHAIRMTDTIFSTFDEPRYAAQARRLFLQVLGKGTTHVRTHADLDPRTGMAAVCGTLAARAELKDRLHVEVVAFASTASDPADSAVRARLRDCARLGVDLLGAVPAFYADPHASIDALLDLAQELGLGVDVHLDEHLDAARSSSGYLARATRARGMQRRVTLSHGCAISSLDGKKRRRVADQLAAAEITVISLPMTNLYLQGRGTDLPGARGLTAVKELAAAGVALRFASDNIQDGFFPGGGGDLLDVAHLMMMTAQLDDPSLLVRGICGGRDPPLPGDAADFVLLPGASLVDVMGNRPPRRTVVQAGAVTNAAAE